MIAVSKCIPSIHLPNLDTSCEILWVKLCIAISKDIYVGAFYRPHVSDISSLEQLNISLKLRNSTPTPQIWLSDDFNAPYVRRLINPYGNTRIS